MSEHQPKRTGLGCVLVLVCWGIAFLFVPAAAEDDAPTKADSVFNELYGERLEEAAKTSSCDDDVKLAEEMIGDANALDPKAQSELLGLMYTTAARLALRSNDQYGLATKALALLENNVPHSKADALEIRAEILYRDFTAKEKHNDALEEGPDRKQRKECAEIGLKLVETLKEFAAVRNAEGKPGEALAVLAKAVDLAEKLEMVPDDLKELARHYKTHMGLLKDAARLQEALQKRPANVHVRTQLIRLCIVGLDEPGRAAKLMTPSVPEPWRTYVPLACTPVGDLSDQQCYQLADWYYDLARKAPDAGRPALLKRTAVCYEGFLKKHPKADTQVAKVRASLAQVEEQLAEQGAGIETLAARGEQVELLDLVIPALDARRGKWKRTKLGLVAMDYEGSTYGRLMKIPVKVEGDYELEAIFARTDGKQSIMFTVPVGDRSVTVFPGTGKGYAGLGMIGQKEPWENETKTRFRLKNNKAYKLTITVRRLTEKKVSIAVKLNEKDFLKWQGNPDRLEPPRRGSIKTKGMIGFGSYIATGVFRSITIRLLDEKGSLKMMRE